MNNFTRVIASVLILYSCNNQQENKKIIKAIGQDISAPIQITIVADLHDSLQPKIISLDRMPKPLVVQIPNKAGGSYTKSGSNGVTTSIDLKPPIKISLPILRNKEGEPILDKDGKTFILGDGGISNFTNFTTDDGLALDGISCSVMDNVGNLWFGTYGGGVCRFDGKSFSTFTTAKGLADNSVSSILEDKDGNLWFGTDGGVSRFDGKSFSNFTTAQGLANNKVWSILEDKDGNLWFGTAGGGVSRYDGKSFSTFTTAQGLANNSVWSILEVKSGDLWFGTEGGISRYDGKSFSTFTTAQGLANNKVWSILEDKSGNLWFGTLGGGVSRFDGKSFSTFTTAQGLANNSVWSILEDKSGDLWFGTEGGVSRYDGKSFSNFTTAQGLANNKVWSILEDKDGNLWFGTGGGGVSRFDGKFFSTFTTAQGLANNKVPSILEDKNGNLWFGTLYGGVSRFDGKFFSTFTTAQGLANNTVYSILEDKGGNIWFGTDGGGVSRLLRRNLEELQENIEKVKSVCKVSFDNFSIGQGLANDVVYDIVEDKEGNVIIGTNLGFTFIPAKMSSMPFSEVKSELEYYNESNGYPIKDVNNNAMLCDSKGIIWAGTGSSKSALVRFDYAAVQRIKQPPVLVIQRIKVNEENICWYNLKTNGIRQNAEDSATALLQEFWAYEKVLSKDENDSIINRFGDIQFDSITKFYPLPQNLVLPFRHNQISFEFTAIETSKPQLVRYQYILEGYDKNWSPVTNRTNASFGNIREGTYTFRLKALGANGFWTEPIAYTFRVLPPWYRTWWAYLIYILIFLGALRIFSKWRERNLREEKEKLERTVAKRTEELTSEKKKSDELLLNILPEEVAVELKAKGSAKARHFDEVTVLFTDFKDFTQMSEQMTAGELVEEIHTCFMAFDHIIEKHGLEKIKTIGDSYMCAGGLPVANKTHAVDVVGAGLEILHFILNRKTERTALGKKPFEIRIGIHTGPVVAGIVGIKKFAYDIWGDTVNTASRMENSGETGKVNISGTTYNLVKDKFICTHRGKIQAKNKGELDMYFVEEKI
ncbi:MAG: two-component regulator propeller domain-containing protein [Bacteroidia bacterium]